MLVNTKQSPMAFKIFATVSAALLFSVSFGVDRDEVTYFLFNRELCNVQIDNNSLNLVNVNNPIIFITHGWVSDSNRSWVWDLTDAYLEKGNYNVITVDWSGPAGSLYPSTVDDVRYIGQYLGEILNTLYTSYKADPSTIHLIGHSLGAHVSGFAGKTLQNLSEVSVGRITGLDAALPLFSLVEDADRLSKGDADLVVAIHTDGGFAGFLDDIGDIDFFPNGGRPPQPGCLVATSCSHVRATEYFVEAVEDASGFASKECSSYIAYNLGLCEDKKTLNIGGNLTVSDAGVYYLKTNSKQPYSIE